VRFRVGTCRGSSVIRGIVPIVPTPFSDDGAVDLPSLRRLVDHLVDAGVHGLAVLGVASEVYALTDAERIAIVETAVEQAAGRLPVVAGNSHASGEGGAELGRQVEAAGASMLMVMPPHFVKPSPRALVDYFATIAGAVAIPIMIQDNPGWTTVSIPVSAYRELARVDNIRFAKIEVPHPPTKMREVRAALGDRLTILGGQAGNWFPEELAAGSVGTMPAALMPEVYVGVWERWQAGDVAGARTLFHRYHPAIRVTAQQSVGFAMVKHLLWQRGVIDSPRVRNPLQPLSEADRADVEGVIAELGL
jgi:2-keto-3-deoxy-L-arabinonate dehydratase